MATYNKWCVFGLAEIALFCAIMLGSQAIGDETVRMVVRLLNCAWFFPLNLWSFDRQLKAEKAAGLPPLKLHG